MVARLGFVLTFSLIESKFLFHWQALKFWFCSHTTCNMHDANYLVLNLHVYSGFPASGKIMGTWKMKKTFSRPRKVMEFEKSPKNLEK